MTITRKNWSVLGIAAFLGFLVWFNFTYPQFAFINLSVTREQALVHAKEYLKSLDVPVEDYKTAVVFVGAGSADRYLQRTLGFDGTMNFIKEHGYEYFFWRARFYRENEEEQYRVTVSAATGEVTNFKHSIKSTAARPFLEEEESKQKVITFFKEKFNVNPNDYILHSNVSKKQDNRTDYSFVWEKKDVFVRWNHTDPNAGGAKLTIGATISGDEILTFNKISLKIPQDFKRYIRKQRTVGSNLALLFRIAFFVLLTTSIFYVVVRRNDLVMHTTKNFCIGITFTIFILNVAVYFNEFENILYHYSTTSSFPSYLWRSITQFVMDTFIVTISILMPVLAGESLHYETFPEKKEGSFLHYIRTSFFSKDIFALVCLGYVTALIMLGIQSAAFEIGQRYLNVWIEYIWMATLSASYLPFLAAFIVGFVASTTEELAFRLFSISLGKKFLKNTFLAVLFASIIWGYGHSTYLVFPMWFRGLEVTLMGIFLAYIYLNFGIIPVLIAHYLFDAFWGTSAYILGKSTPFNFYTSLCILILPLVYGLVCLIRDRSIEERPLVWRLNKHQTFNLAVLQNFLKENPPAEGKPLIEVKKEIMNHGWDLAVVEMALKDFKKND